LDAGPKPIPLVDGGAAGLVADHSGCSVGLAGGRRPSGVSLLGLIPLLAWVAAHAARRRRRS
jgi:hypothetical protein